MRPENQIYAALILLSHGLFIAIGAVIAFFIPSSSPATARYELKAVELQSQKQSDEQLQSWLNILSLPHHEMFVDRESLESILEANKAIPLLDFFAGVDEQAKVDFLANRISSYSVEESAISWDVILSNASQSDANMILSTLGEVYGTRVTKIANSFETPIATGIKVLDLPRDDEEVRSQSTLGKACNPWIGALLAVVIVVATWSSLMPSSRRRISIWVSLVFLTGTTFLSSITGALVGYVVDSRTSQWQSEMILEFENLSTVDVQAATYADPIVGKIHDKLCRNGYEDLVTNKSFLQNLISAKKLKDWKTFRSVLEETGGIDQLSKLEVEDVLLEAIHDRLSVETNSELKNYLTLKFHCEHRIESTQFLACIADTLNNSIERQNDFALESIERGAQITNDRLEVHRRYISEKPKKMQAIFGSPTCMTFCYMGAVLALIVVSAAKVSLGLPPV